MADDLLAPGFPPEALNDPGARAVMADYFEEAGDSERAAQLRPLKTMLAVSRGSYSDYQVLAVFEDEATAHLWCDAMVADGEQYEKPFLESLLLVPANTKPRKVSSYAQSVELWDDGRIDSSAIRVRCEFPIAFYDGPPPFRPHVRYVRAPCHKNSGGRLEVRADTEEKVVKVVAEKVAMWKAGAWGGPAHEEIIEDN